MKLSELIKQSHFESAGAEAILNVIVTGSWLLGETAGALEPYNLTPVQYNVLRILRGSHPDKMTCSDIGARLLDRTPDVTRLLNRLERNELIFRERAEHDRRVVLVGIRTKGIDLLEKAQKDMDALMQRLTRHLSEDEHRTLSMLLERLRTDQKA